MRGENALQRMSAVQDVGVLRLRLSFALGARRIILAQDDRAYFYAAPLLSFNISNAARRPGAPMMPPPGCVAEPHM